MNRYQVMFGSSIAMIGGGILGIGYSLLGKKGSILIGLFAIVLLSGLALLGSWIGKAYTYICMKCFLRIDLGIFEALTALPAGGECRRIYCPKCRKKENCKARRVSLRAHVY